MNKRTAEESKKQILAAAGTIFAKQGYAHASIRGIAKAAGISVGGVYLYFKNKEELYLTMMHGWMDNLNDKTTAALRKIDDPSEALRIFITLSIDNAQKHKEMIMLHERELGFSFGINVKKHFFRERRQLIARIVSKGIEAGVFRSCNAEEAAKVIFNIHRGFILSMVIDNEALFSAEECVDLVLNGLLRRNSE